MLDSSLQILIGIGVIAAAGFTAGVFVFFKSLGSVPRDILREELRRASDERLLSMRGRSETRLEQTRLYASSQAQAYLDLWSSIQSLSLTVDTLWERVTPENVAVLAGQLRKTKEDIRHWWLFFDNERQYEQILRIIERLEAFHAGKIRLIDLHDQEDMLLVFPDILQEQIARNGQIRDELNTFIEELRRSFQSRLTIG